MKKSLARNAVPKLKLNVFNIIILFWSEPFGPVVMGDINYIQSLYTYLVVFSNFGVYQYRLLELSRVRGDRNRFDDVFSNLFFIPVASLIRRPGLGTFLNFFLFIAVNTVIYLLLLFPTKEPFLEELRDMVKKKRR